MSSIIPGYLQNVIANAPYSVALLDQHLCYISASKQWTIDFSLQDDFYGRSITAVFPLMGARWKNILENAAHGVSHKNEGELVLSLDGSQQWLRWDVQPWLNDAGEIKGVIIYLSNLSKEKENESALKRKLDLYEQTNQVARIGAWEFDVVQDKLYWSPVTKQIYGFPDDYEPEVKATLKLFKQERSREQLKEYFYTALKTGAAYEMELQLVTAQGNEVWVRTKANTVMVNGVCTIVYGTFQDIQHQKLQEIELANSEIKYRSIIENSRYSFLLTKPGRVVIDANQAALDTFGYTREEFCKLSRYDLLDKNDPRFDEFLENRARDGKATAELTAIRKNGERFPCEISSVIYTNTEGENINSLVIIDISERRSAEEKIKFSEEQFRGAFEFSAIGMAIFGVDGFFKRVNQSLCDMLGYTKEELVRLGIQHITHAEDLTWNMGLMKDLIDGVTDSYHIEKRYLHKNGSSVWVLLGVSILRDAEGQPIHFISQIQNITEHRLAENLVSEERKLLRTVIDNIPVNIYIKDLDSRKTMINRTEQDYMNGLTEEEILGKTDFELFPKEFAEKSLKEETYVFTTGLSIFNKEVVDEKPDGTVKYLLTSKIPLRNSNNEIIGLLGISYDITPIKEAEYALAVSEDKYRKIFENTQDIYYRTDHNGIVTEISPSVEKYYGYQRKHVVGNPVTDFYYYKEDSDQIMQALKQDYTVTDFEVKLRTNTNELLYASVNARLIVEDGMILGTEGSIRDITLRKVQENELTSLNTELKALNNHREKLLSVIGHDLRNPVAASLKLADLALMDIEETSKGELIEYLVRMQTGLRHANELLEDLLHWAKNQFNSMSFSLVLIKDLQLQVRVCMERIKPMAEIKGIELVEDVEQGINLFADPDMLDAIIRNLISNAIKFTKEGRVTVAAHSRVDDVLFSVTDTGSGISAQVIDQLFNKSFSYTTYGTAGERGTGLGLELCRDFVERHRGKIWVESREGTGSVFYFTIPF